MSGISPNPLNAISKVYLEKIAVSEAKVDKLKPEHERATARDKRYDNPSGALELGGGVRRARRAAHRERDELNKDAKDIRRGKTGGPQFQGETGKERIAAVKKAKGMKEALDPVGQEDADIDNDGVPISRDKNDQYIMKRRKAIAKAMKKRMKEEKEISEVTKMGIHAPHEVPSKDLKGLVKKAVKRIDADNDGDVDKDDPKEKGMGEFVPSPDGKKKLRTKIGESMSNWRTDLSEVMDDEIDSKKIKEKKVNNKIKINPNFGEAIEEIGGTIIEMVEIDEFDYIIESVYGELLEEGYENCDIEEALEYALIEAKVTFGHDTPTKKDDVMKKAKGRLRYLGRKVGEKIGSAKKSAKYASAKAQVAAYNKGREVAQTAGDKTRKARQAVAAAPKKAKSNLKGFIKRQAERVASRMSEETISEETPAERIDRISKENVAKKAAAAKTEKEKRTKSAADFQAHKKEVLAKGGLPVDALDSWQKKKMSKEEVEIDEKLNMKKEKMGDVIKDFYKSDAPQFKGKSKEKRRQMAIAAKLTAERGGRKLGEGATETAMSPQELALQKRKTQIDQMIAKKRQQSLQKAGKSTNEEVESVEEGIGMTMAKAVGNPPALSKRMKLKQALLNREIKKNAALNKKKTYSGKAATNEEVEQVNERNEKVEAEYKRAKTPHLLSKFRKENPGSRQEKKVPGAKETEGQAENRRRRAQAERAAKHGLTSKEKKETQARAKYYSERD